MGEGHSHLRERDAGRNVAYGVEQCRAKESNDEGFRDFRARLELEGPENQHPDRPGKELKRSQKPWEWENIECLLVEDVEDNVLEVPEPENEGKLASCGLRLWNCEVGF